MALQYEVGRYWGKIIDQKLGESSGGHPQWEIRFLVLGKVNPANPDGDLIACPELERTFYRIINENTIEFVLKDCETLDWPLTQPSKQIPTDSPDCIDIRGKELAFYCKVGQNQQGVSREEWSLAMAGGPATKPLEQPKQSALDRMFGAAVRAKKGTTAVPAKTRGVAKQEAPQRATPKPPPSQMTVDDVNSELDADGRGEEF